MTKTYGLNMSGLKGLSQTHLYQKRKKACLFLMEKSCFLPFWTWIKGFIYFSRTIDRKKMK
ncbi:hypothetical protein C656_04730 [Enterococcus hirae 57-03-H11]|nr:hypothetical protein C656_04730 [Enterococcus hirae 57-03-H11]ROX91822.1 hypothetical protein EGW49_09665 [Enterococcus hirae]ROY00775.1 hypothetical protein EGW54_11120 [Enterococcus hirae]ROY47799.1 hypothetical protein EGW66_11500 [Enterococcus hirae]